MDSLSTIGTVISGIGIIALVIISFYSGGVLNSLTKKIPQKNLLEGVLQTNQQLKSSIDSHKTVILDMPKQVSDVIAREVHKGMKPLNEELKQFSNGVEKNMITVANALHNSHQQFVGAVITLNAEGNLTEWVNSLKEVVVPLKATSSSLGDHFGTAEKLLKTTENLVVQWTEQRKVVENAFVQFSQAIGKWTIEETTRFGDVEHRIMNRLQEVANTNVLVSRGLSELQSAQSNMTNSQRELSDTVHKTILKMHEIMELSNRTQEQHTQLIRGQGEVQNQAKTLISGMENWFNTMDNKIQKVLVEFEATHRTFSQHVEDAIKSMLKAMSHFNDQHLNTIDRLTQQSKILISDQQQFLKKQDAFFQRVNRLFSEVPTKNIQVVVAILLSLQVAISAIIAFKLLAN